MASSRLPRLFMEVAPPQFVTVMRHRTRKMLDTINEEDRDGSNDDNSLSPTSKSSPTAIPVSATMVAAAAAAAAASSSSATTVMPSSKVRRDWPDDQHFSETSSTSVSVL
ncbi:hypothetical protein Godav_004533 [Gossypium davidsonii]|uniref:Uncharacterized protein n=2 Tax=Gossypium TaxID=3633 RepID=A0A7J8SLM2_GOSDV|nr:hypothetical protein [Gossypium davidsonii]MBA0662594.1 hypothetical protein [Gossypium klotzschianum]